MSPAARILIAVFAVPFGAMMFVHGTTAEPGKAGFSYAFAVFCLFVGAAALLKCRAARFCGSVVGACVFAAGLAYLGHELLSGPAISGSRGKPSILNACFFLLFFGIPGLLYAVKAKFGFGTDVFRQRDEPDDSDAGGSAR